MFTPQITETDASVQIDVRDTDHADRARPPIVQHLQQIREADRIITVDVFRTVPNDLGYQQPREMFVAKRILEERVDNDPALVMDVMNS